MATAALAVLLLLSCSRAAAGSQGLFILDKPEQVVHTDAGEVRVVRGLQSPEHPHPINLVFISMEPNTLFVPQYLDSSIVLFIRRGDAKISWIQNFRLMEKELKDGDINRIPAGSAFYIVNTGKSQRLQIIAAVDTSESLIFEGTYHTFSMGGGHKSILAGFDPITIATAYNVTLEELAKVIGTPTGGPIIYINGKAPEHTRELASIMRGKMRWAENEDEQDDSRTWSPRTLLNSVLGGENDRWGNRAPDSSNLFDKEPGYKNKYGHTTVLGERDYNPLEKSGVGVYHVYLTAGAMVAPHVNPMATEYGVVLNGSGIIQVVYPNGTSAMNAEVHEGDLFWVPRYFPFCQIASLNGPMEFFGFTTSAQPNNPQFLAGRTSVLTTMMGSALAAGFGTTEEKLRKFVGSQEYEVILPPWQPSKKKREEPDLIKMKVAM